MIPAPPEADIQLDNDIATETINRVVYNRVQSASRVARGLLSHKNHN